MSVLQLRQRVAQGTPYGWPDSVHPVLQAVYAARGVFGPAQVEHRLARLLPPSTLGGIAQAVDLLATAVREDWSILIAGDYDCDGATGTTVAVRGLRLLGARHVGYAIPNRFIHGYGLTPALVASLEPLPQLIVTVDNGVASVAGVAAAKALGIRVIVTDHHLPGVQLPDADAMVNPNLAGDAFPSKALAGVGVMFYLLLALRARLYPGDRAGREGHGGSGQGASRPDLSSLLDLVALGTVADLVPLDFNNRVLVNAGLQRIRSGRGCAGINALVACAKRSVAMLSASDLGFAVGPRLNAAGRLEDMRVGVECLLCDDPGRAYRQAEQLSAINRERRDLQGTMVAQAEAMVEAMHVGDAVGVALYDAAWHPGVIGLVASKLKDRLHRPVIAFAPVSEDSPDDLRGSARSIAGFHIRDALAAVDARIPGLIERFGGHAMAAGLSLRRADYPRFAAAFDALAREWIAAESLQAVLYTDGELPPATCSLALARQLRDGGPWGQAFPAPVFANLFECAGWKRMGEAHWRLQLRDPRDGALQDAVMFNVDPARVPPPRLRAAYELTVNEWQGRESARLLLRHVEPA
ncbi:MAG: single-stranded-DNA-specific exonuclease RecJ [Rhodanobacter sp.]